MKKLIIILIISSYQLANLSVFSQAPEKMSYQAVIRDNTGELVMNKKVGVRIQIKRSSEFGEAVYVETHFTNTNENGLISLEIGGGTIVLGSFGNIDWAHGPYFIYSEIDPTGKTNYSIFALSQLLSVPYALHAKIADSVPGVATKAYVDELIAQVDELILLSGMWVKDIDRNIYKTIHIGKQTWMAENLRVTKFTDGTAITNISDNYEWASSTLPGYCWYNSEESKYKKPYGAYYNWYAISKDSLCPTGWHIPTKGDYDTLMALLSDGNKGGKLKETGYTHWENPNTGATDEIGFSAIAGGLRQYGEFVGFGFDCWFWYNANISNEVVKFWGPTYNNAQISYGISILKSLGCQVRCIKN